MEKTPKCYCILINKGNRTKWSPRRSVIISVINAVVRFVKSRVSSQIELGDSKFFYQLIIATTKFVILLIRLLKIKTQEIPIVLCPAVKKKLLKCGTMARTVQLLRHHAYCSVTLSVDSQSDSRICYSYD